MRNKTYNKRKILIVFLCACSVILLLIGRLVYLMIFDAEYYQKKYLAYQDIINRHDVLPLFKIAAFLIGPFGSAYDTSSYVEQSDYRYIRGQDVKPFCYKILLPDIWLIATFLD